MVSVKAAICLLVALLDGQGGRRGAQSNLTASLRQYIRRLDKIEQKTLLKMEVRVLLPKMSYLYTVHGLSQGFKKK